MRQGKHTSLQSTSPQSPVAPFVIYVERGHSRSCQIKDTDPFWSNTNKHVWRDHGGGKRGNTTPWTRWRCNNLDCRATILVKDFSVAELINRALAEDK